MALSRTNHFINGEVANATPLENEFDLFLANINQRLHADGTVALTGNQTMTKANPELILEGTGGNEKKWRIREGVESAKSYFYIDVYNGSWVNAFKLCYDPSEYTEIAGYLKLIGGVVWMYADTPTFIMQGSEVAAEKFRIQETAGVLNIDVYDGVSAWDNAISIDNAAQVTIGDFVVNDLGVGNNLTVGGDLSLTGNFVSADKIGTQQIAWAEIADDNITGSGDDATQWKTYTLAGAGEKIFFVEITSIVRGDATHVFVHYDAGLVNDNDTHKFYIRFTVDVVGGTGPWTVNFKVYELEDGIV